MVTAPPGSTRPSPSGRGQVMWVASIVPFGDLRPCTVAAVRPVPSRVTQFGGAPPAMTAVDIRPIAEESARYNAVLTHREDLTDALAFFKVSFEGDPVGFEPGQYLTIGVESDGKLIQ